MNQLDERSEVAVIARLESPLIVDWQLHVRLTGRPCGGQAIDRVGHVLRQAGEAGALECGDEKPGVRRVRLQLSRAHEPCEDACGLVVEEIEHSRWVDRLLARDLHVRPRKGLIERRQRRGGCNGDRSGRGHVFAIGEHDQHDPRTQPIRGTAARRCKAPRDVRGLQLDQREVVRLGLIDTRTRPGANDGARIERRDIARPVERQRDVGRRARERSGADRYADVERRARRGSRIVIGAADLDAYAAPQPRQERVIAEVRVVAHAASASS